MSGAGALLKICTASGGWGVSGKPERWLVTITGELFLSNVASARNSNATNTDPVTAK